MRRVLADIALRTHGRLGQPVFVREGFLVLAFIVLASLVGLPAACAVTLAVGLDRLGRKRC